jgi:plastocyanin
MTWLWRIFLSGCWLLPVLAGQVTGNIELSDSRELAVRKHKDFSGVVVWLEPVAASAASAKPRPQHAVMAQKAKMFMPHVLAIPAGTAVDFPNFDPIFHNAFSSYSGQIFDVGLYPPGGSRTVVFKREGVVRVFCNIHATMSAVIVVLKTPYFAVSGAAGSYEIPNVPPGNYRLHVFHERAAEENLQSLVRAVEVTTAPLHLPRLVISESGYLQAPHKNKFGKDYPASDDHLLYPGSSR